VNPLSRGSLAGAASLAVAGPLVIAGTLVAPSMSDDAADQTAALAAHRAAVIAGQTISAVALALLIAGTVWLAWRVAPHSPRLAFAGGVLGVFGSLIILFENGLAAAAPSVVRGLDPAQATAALDRINSSVANGLDPLSLLGDVGLVLLGIASMRIGVPSWAAATFGAGAIVELVGFATATRILVVLGFALFFVGALAITRIATRAAGALESPARAPVTV
jgi:hypothetical protein